MNEDKIREALAELAHEQWSGWMRYFFRKCSINDDGDVTVSAGYVTALWKQIETPYALLSEAEKDMDRDEANRMMKVFKEAL
jgi:hypothetical protein